MRDEAARHGCCKGFSDDDYGFRLIYCNQRIFGTFLYTIGIAALFIYPRLVLSQLLVEQRKSSRGLLPSIPV